MYTIIFMKIYMETSISKLYFSMPSVQRSAIFEGVLMCLTTAVRALKVCLFKPANAQHRTGENDGVDEEDKRKRIVLKPRGCD